MTLWWYVSPDHDMIWRAVVRAGATGASTRDAITQQICGEPVPPAELLISFGKPLLSGGIYPLFLSETTSAYWSQRPGFSLSECDWRRILYDHRYLRATWVPEKQRRTADIPLFGDQPQDHIVGLGRRVGAFWIAAEQGGA